MRVSAKADYACIAMVELAARHRTGQPVQIKTIAEAHDISPRFLVQILLQLKGAGLVSSSRGTTGGYQLARQPASISLADIITTIESSPTSQPAMMPLPQSTTVQAVRQVWQELGRMEQTFLENTTLADLVRRSQERDLPSYQI